MPRKPSKTAQEPLKQPEAILGTLTITEAPKKKIGRPSKYTPELAAEICERLSNGEPLRQICRDDHMPAWQKIYEWMQRDDALGEGGAGLSGAIARARETGQDAIAEEIWLDMKREPERILSEGGGRVDAGYVQWQKAKAEIGLKLLAKWNPKRYGDRVQLAGDAESPIKVEAELQADKLLQALITNAELKKKAEE